jgi:sporulation protein YlmC with PRC-barrel domain
MIDLGWRHHHLLTKGVHMPGTADLHIMREREVIDVGGTHLGRAEDLYADERTGEAVFLLVSGGRFGTKLHFVPVEGAEIEGEKIRIAFTADQVSNAPNISADESLSPSEEEQLFHHYGMDGHDGTTTILVVWVATG